MGESMATEKKKARRIAVISGKGGVGKSVITANLAAALSLRGRKILVIDADLGLASLDIILGIEPPRTIFDAIHRGLPVDEILFPTTKGFDLIPAGSSLQEGTLFTQGLAKGVEMLLASLEDRYDAILFDVGAGIGDVVLFFAGLSHQILLVATPEPTSVMDAYATIKVLHNLHGRREFLLVANQANPDCSSQVGESIAGHLRNVISQYLESGDPIKIELVGSIPFDPMVTRSVRERKLLMETSPEAPSAYGLNHLAVFLDTRLSM
jgi:flagellar biosynthesis protein FlhG